MDASPRLKFSSTETDLPVWQRQEDEETRLPGQADPLAALFRECRPGGAMPEVPGYRILKYAGKGGEAVVWQAVRNADCREVALKVPHNAEECSERLLREGRILASMDHPGVMRMLGLAETSEGIPVLVLEWLQGTNLADLILPGGLPFEKVALLFGQILEAVEHAHSRGMVHRDLKPGNILIGHDGSPKVLDFGLAKKLIPGGGMSSMVTMSGCVAGTPEYLAPEGFEPGTRAGVVADVYALGIMLYELLTGQPPRGSWPRLSQVKRLDVRLDVLMSEATASDPNRRLKSAEVFRRRLTGILTSRPRYSGVPLSGWRVRTMDALWTVAGIYAAAAAYCSFERLDGVAVPVWLDLTMGRDALLGGWISAAFLCLIQGGLWAWQGVRLRKFRNVRLTEALPAPFGFLPDTGWRAALTTGLGQVLCLWAGLFLTVALFFKSNHWITADTPFWQRGLCVTAAGDLTPVSPWTWHPQRFFDAGAYVLREVRRGVTAGSLTPYESHPFLIFSGPLVMVLAAGAVLAGMLPTAWAACQEWRQRGGRLVLAPAMGVLAALFFTGYQGWSQDSLRTGEGKNRDQGIQKLQSEIFETDKEELSRLVKCLFGGEYPADCIPALGQKYFEPVIKMAAGAGTVDWSRENLLEEMRKWRASSLQNRATVEDLQVTFEQGALFEPDTPRTPVASFVCILCFQHYFDSFPDEKGRNRVIGRQVTLKWRGSMAAGSSHLVFGHWAYFVKDLYGGPVEDVSPARDPAFAGWLGSFLDELNKPAIPGIENFLMEAMLTCSEHGPGSVRRIYSHEAVPEMLRIFCGGRLELALPPPNFEALPGGRWKVRFNVRRLPGSGLNPEGTDNHVMEWGLDVVRISGKWRILRMKGI